MRTSLVGWKSPRAETYATVDLSTITEVIGGQTGKNAVQQKRSQSIRTLSNSINGPRSPPATGVTFGNLLSTPLSFALVSQDSVVAELVAPDQSTHSEWIDGINLLLPDGFIAMKETADFIQALTDIEVKVKLLDFTGEKLEVPTALPVPIPPPASIPFFYSE